MLTRHAHDIEGALAELWGCGGDVDTVAALYTACIGAWQGTRAFDTQVIESLQGAAVLAEEAARLVAVFREDGESSRPA